jgi:hypothetical protein
MPPSAELSEPALGKGVAAASRPQVLISIIPHYEVSLTLSVMLLPVSRTIKQSGAMLTTSSSPLYTKPFPKDTERPTIKRP